MVKKKTPVGKLKRSNKFLIIAITILVIIGVFVFTPKSTLNSLLLSQVVWPPTTEAPGTSTCESTDPQNKFGGECGKETKDDIFVTKTPLMIVSDSICHPAPVPPSELNKLGKYGWWIPKYHDEYPFWWGWEVDPDKKNEYDAQMKKYYEALDKFNEICTEQAKKHRRKDIFQGLPLSDNIGKCKGCPDGSSGCVNPLGEGNYRLSDLYDYYVPEDPPDSPFEIVNRNYNKLVEIYRDEWSVCYHAYCGGTDGQSVQVEWSCGRCKADDCSESSNKAAEEAATATAKAKAATEAAYQSEVNAMGANTITTSTAGPGSGTVSRVQADPSNPAVLTLVPVPQAGSLFTGFTGACTGKEPCNLLIGNKMSTTATFVLAPVNGECGATINTCKKGTFSDATDSLPQYLWSCLGKNGGTNAPPCSANKPVYTVTYNANKATSGVVPAGQKKIYEVNLTLAKNPGNLRRTGYTFAGWNTAANVTGTNYPIASLYKANTNVILYAKWVR